MACGPSLYYNKYKNMSVEELNNLLTQLKDKNTLRRLMRNRADEIKRGIDDNSCVANHNSQVAAIHILINYKTMYPNSDLSKCDDLFLVKNAVENKNGPVDKDRNSTKQPVDYDKVLAEFFLQPPKNYE